MARVKLTEFAAKTLLQQFGIAKDLKVFAATNNTTQKELQDFFGDTPLVVKVDQGIKKRGLLGLMKVNLNQAQVTEFIQNTKDYQNFIVEPLFAHKKEDEQYLSLERTRTGFLALHSPKGGVEVEQTWANINKYNLPQELAKLPPALQDFCQNLCNFMNQFDISFIEINPLVCTSNNMHILDAAVLIDDVSQALITNATIAAGIVPEGVSCQEEETVIKLNANTPASLKLKVLNKNGSIWMLLSGGGASIVLADELADLGYGPKIGNYGEYSGSPSTQDVYEYTKCILSLMFASNAEKKVLVIAGGVANFTDVAKTFKGIIMAITQNIAQMQKQNIKVFVRRGGPNQKAGLAQMEVFLQKNNILGNVSDASHDLSSVVSLAIKSL